MVYFYQFELLRGYKMSSDYIKELLKDYSNLCHRDFMRKYKPDELIKARKLSLQDQHKSFIDNQVKTRQAQLIKN